MAQKKFVNNTPYVIEGIIGVRDGQEPGQTLDTVNFELPAGPGNNLMVAYGDDSNPFMDSLEISAMSDGAVIMTDQIIITRSSALDNEFNMNDTVYIAMSGQNFNVTSGNTWT